MNRTSLHAAFALLVLGMACGKDAPTLPSPPKVVVPTKLAITTAPTSTPAGAALSITVALQDSAGQTATTTPAEVSVALANGSGGATLSGTTTVQAVNGVATFSNLAISKTGAGYTLVASSAGLASATSAAFEVTSAAVARLAFTTQPTSSVAGALIAPTIQVTLYDSYDNVATSSFFAVSLAPAAGTPPIIGTPAVNPVNGVATFSGMYFRKSGTGFRITASMVGGPTTTSAAFDVGAAAPDQLKYLPPPAGATEVMEPIGTPQVAVTDFYDNIVTSSTIPITLLLSLDTVGTKLVGTTTVNAVNGVARFDNVAIDRPGVFNVTAHTSGGGAVIFDATSTVTITLTPRTITAGGAHSCVLNSNGYAFCWGDNSAGQLGDGTVTERTRPVPVSGHLSFVQIRAGSSHTCGLSLNRIVYCWGSNAYGQLGDGSNFERHEPVPVTGGLQFRAIETGGDHTCGIGPVLEASTLHCWGRNTHGQLGDGSNTDRTAPALVSGVDPRSVAADSLHTCSVNWIDLKAFCWGDNTYGQLGDGTTAQRTSPTPIVGVATLHFIAVGAKHTCGGITLGNLYCWGSNAHGEMGSGSIGGADVTSPSLVNGVSAFGVVAGGHTVCKTDPILCWGRNSEGELADGTTTDRATPVPAAGVPFDGQIAVGNRHSCVITVNVGDLYCWGQNDHGQVGDGTKTNRTSPVKLLK